MLVYTKNFKVRGWATKLSQTGYIQALKNIVAIYVVMQKQ